MMTDPIADLLTRIRNASTANHPVTRVPASKMKQRLLAILKQEGFITDYSHNEKGPQGTLEVVLKYMPSRKGVITGIRRMSKPGCRQYCKSTDIPKVLNGLGVAIVSTSHGLMTGHKARKAGVGGELVCAVW
jgi:small subunit ribosomal protein S8